MSGDDKAIGEGVRERRRMSASGSFIRFAHETSDTMRCATSSLYFIVVLFALLSLARRKVHSDESREREKLRSSIVRLSL